MQYETIQRGKHFKRQQTTVSYAHFSINIKCVWTVAIPDAVLEDVHDHERQEADLECAEAGEHGDSDADLLSPPRPRPRSSFTRRALAAAAAVRQQSQTTRTDLEQKEI